MPNFFGLAEQALSAANNYSQNGSVDRTGGPQYNAPHYDQQSQGGFDTDQVLSHADHDEESRGFIANAVQHVQDNPQQHQEQVNPGDLSKYSPLIIKAFSSVASKTGLDLSSLTSGGLGQGGGNQLLGAVLKEANNAFGSHGSEEKQSLMNGAAMTLTKLVSQKQLSAFVGGSNSGGLQGLASAGQSFLKNNFS